MGWFLVTIIVPLIAPLIVFALLRPLPLPEAVRSALRWATPVKDGQLCWVAIAFCASALYEYAVFANGRGMSVDTYLQFANGFAIAILVASSIVAAGGSLFRTPKDKPVGIPWIKHYSCFCASLVLALASSVFYAIIHFGIRHT